MSRPEAEDYIRRPRRPDDRPLLKSALRPVPRPAIERLQAVIAQEAANQTPEPPPRGRRKFRDQAPQAPGPQHRRRN